MNIKVIGEGCDKCNKLYNNVRTAVGEAGVEADIEKVEKLIDIVRLGVMRTPTLMIDGEVVVVGRVADSMEIRRLLTKRKG